MKDVKTDYNPDDYKFHRHDPFRYGYWDDEVPSTKEVLWNIAGAIALVVGFLLLVFLN
jgi:hypothetical protein